MSPDLKCGQNTDRKPAEYFSTARIYLLQTELISPDLMCSQSIELNLGASCDLFQQLWYTYRGFRLMHLDPKYGQKQPTKTGSQL